MDRNWLGYKPYFLWKQRWKVRRILHYPGPHGVKVNVGRNRGKRAAFALHKDTDVAPFPKRPCALVALVIGDGVALLEEFQKWADVAHAPTELLLLALDE